MAELRVVMAQMNPLVGDISGNTDAIVELANQVMGGPSGKGQSSLTPTADVLMFPELALTGYPPEDLLLRPSIEWRIERAVSRLIGELPPDLYVVVGYPRLTPAGLTNAAGVFFGGALIAEYAKIELPNYQVFDEKRYFVAGDTATVVDIKGYKVAITVCEDIWHTRPTELAVAAGAEVMLNINASPFHMNKLAERRAVVERAALYGRMPILYVNAQGGQDELVFDGGSMAIGHDGTLRMLAPHFTEGLYPVVLSRDEHNQVVIVEGEVSAEPSLYENVYNALVCGVRDYVNKNGFKGIVLGLSGGIDSALTIAVAVDALGAARCEALMMPFRYTASMSIEDAQAEADALGIRFGVTSIEPMYEAFTTALADEFAGLPLDVTEQNIQARCRGVLLMAISNKKGYLVLTTGNKSEMAVGYSTLYGDMAGGFDVLKDVPKTLVYELCRYRNALSPVIPQRVIDRPPSAELAPDQKDEDSLPPYDILDQILERYVERDMSANAIIADGFDSATVHRVIRLVDINEYKRRQAPVGVRISKRAFGRDRRYPITSGWRAGD